MMTNLAVLAIVASINTWAAVAATTPNFPMAKPNCTDECGNISIPFPLGTREECYIDYSFFVTCDRGFNPPKLFVQNSKLEIADISLDGQIRVLQKPGHDCYAQNGTSVSYRSSSIDMPSHLTVNNTANKFTMVGCDTYGYVYGKRLEEGRNYTTGCTAMCDAPTDLEAGSCTGLGCCQSSIPKHIWNVEIVINSYDNFMYVHDFNNCSYAFVVEDKAITFSPENLTNLKRAGKLPMVVDWAIGNGTCQVNASDYACKSVNSQCYKPDNNGNGYRCSCAPGYRGNPYPVDGCKDRNECKDPSLNICVHRCIDTPGSFKCVCPKGHRGDGKKSGSGCINPR